MKTYILLIAVCILLASCGKKSTEIVLSFTNPQELSVSYVGYYVEATSGDSIALSGVTPREYQITLEQDDAISGKVHKEGSNMVDTLHFRILVDGAEQVSQKTTTPSQVIEFYVSGE